MAVKKIFFDANIFNDIFDKNRTSFAKSSQAFLGALKRGMKIHTSCDVVTTIYYITAKSVSREKALEGIDLLKTSVSILPFGEKELTQTVKLMRKDPDYTDLEDTIQYILALNAQCEVIVTNDKRFVAKEIECLSAEAFVVKYLKGSTG
ncbi:type II toxin-antitoxin system VapC family toxin [Nitratifractor sp.]